MKTRVRLKCFVSYCSMLCDSSCSQWVEQSAREVLIQHGSEDRATSTIEDLLFSSKSIIVVEKQLRQFNDLFKMLLDAHQEYYQLLGNDERGKDDDWSDDVDTQVRSFERKVHCWLRETAQRAKSSKCSSRSNTSVCDKGSMNSKKSKDPHESRASRETR